MTIEFLAIRGDFKADKENAAYVKLIVDSSQLPEMIQIPAEKLLRIRIEEEKVC